MITSSRPMARYSSSLARTCGRRAAGGVAAHHVVAHQPVDLAPVLGGIGRRQRRLVEARAAQTDVLGMMGAAQHEADRPADRIDACFSWRRAWCRRCRACGTAGRPPGAACSRQAFTKGGEVAAEISTPSVCAAGEPQHVGPRGGEHDRDVARRRWPAAGRTTPKTWPWKSAISPANSWRQIFTASPIVDQRLGRLDAGRLEIGRRARAEAEDDPAGIHLVEARRRHGDVDRMRRIGAHRHQRDLDLLGRAPAPAPPSSPDRAGRDGRRSTASRRRPLPPRCACAAMSAIGARPSIADAELSHGRSRSRLAAPPSAPSARPARPAARARPARSAPGSLRPRPSAAPRSARRA